MEEFSEEMIRWAARENERLRRAWHADPTGRLPPPAPAQPLLPEQLERRFQLHYVMALRAQEMLEYIQSHPPFSDLGAEDQIILNRALSCPVEYNSRLIYELRQILFIQAQLPVVPTPTPTPTQPILPSFSDLLASLQPQPSMFPPSTSPLRMCE